MVLPDGGTQVHTPAPRASRRIRARCLERPSVAAGNVYNCGDPFDWSLRKWVEATAEKGSAPSSRGNGCDPGRCRGRGGDHAFRSEAKPQEKCVVHREGPPRLGWYLMISPMDALRETGPRATRSDPTSIRATARRSPTRSTTPPRTLIDAWRRPQRRPGGRAVHSGPHRLSSHGPPPRARRPGPPRPMTRSARPALDGLVAVVTGGASGIGRATALRMLDAGASVAVGDLNQENADSRSSPRSTTPTRLRYFVDRRHRRGRRRRLVRTAVDDFGGLGHHVQQAWRRRRARPAGRDRHGRLGPNLRRHRPRCVRRYQARKESVA